MEGSGRGATRRGRPLPIALAGLALVAMLVAVGAAFDLGPFSDQEGGVLTTAQFIAKGDEICRHAHEQFADLQPTPPNTSDEAAVLTGKLLTISEDEYNAIRNLEPPADLKPAVTRYLGARVQGINLIRDAYEAAKSNDPRTYYRDLVRVSKTQVKRLKLAKAVGFTECSKPIAALNAPAQQ
jgi:hypothetical protein